MRFLIPSLLALLLPMVSMAQNCLGVAFRPGMAYEMSTYNAKDKLTGKVAYRIESVKQEGGSTLVDVSTQSEDEKGKKQPAYTIRYTCTGNELVADLSGMAQSMQNAGMKDMDMRLKTNRLVYPATLSTGLKLPDGQLEADMLNNGSTMMTMNMTMTNRVVGEKESITTPAGTFNAFKISSDMNLENRAMGIPIRATMRTVSYRTNDQLLDIRTETYNKNGKLMGYTLLSKVN